MQQNYTIQKITKENYPYGYKKTTAFFSIEFVKGKGFRSIFQTINPTNGKLNNPKKGVYHPVLVMRQNESGHVSYLSLDFNGAEAFNKGCNFMSENFELFTSEQIKYIYAHAFNMLKINTKSMVIYCGSKFDDIKPILQLSCDLALDGFNNGVNNFKNMFIDIEALEKTKIPDFNPFKVTTYIPFK